MSLTGRPTWQLKRGAYKQVHGENYGTPKEVWGFRTKAASGAPRAIAREFLNANTDLFEIEQGLAGLEIQRVIQSLGATHVILRQAHKGRSIHRGYISVHMDRAGRVFLVKNRTVPARLLPDRFEKRLDRDAAVRRARHSLPKKQRLAKARSAKLVWFPVEAKLVLAWKVRLTRQAPREEWLVYLDARTGFNLSSYDNLAQASTGRGLVFDPNPVTALGDHRLLLTPKKRARQPPPVAYREVSLLGLDTSGTLSGDRVSTQPTRRRVRSANGKFLLSAHERGFEEVMVYYHVDAALRYLEELGYRGARAIFRQPVPVNVNGSRDDNSWYSPEEQMLTFGTGDIDDAEDGETILHELGHAIQDAICPGFGQSDQAAAMGEGFGDYFAASFFAERKPPRYHDTVMSWDGLLLGLSSRTEPPGLRRLDSALTFTDFVEDGDEHDNGVIWSATLWEIRAALTRPVADKIIIESHFQLDGFTKFDRGARAIMDADRHLYGGRHRDALANIFRRRKIAPL